MGGLSGGKLGIETKAEEMDAGRPKQTNKQTCAPTDLDGYGEGKFFSEMKHWTCSRLLGYFEILKTLYLVVQQREFGPAKVQKQVLLVTLTIKRIPVVVHLFVYSTPVYWLLASTRHWTGQWRQRSELHHHKTLSKSVDSNTG